MPAMAVCALIVLGRVLTLGTPDPSLPEQNVINGLGYMWNPNFEALANPQTWLAAAGQIVEGEQLRRNSRGLPIRSREHQRAQYVLHRPAGIHELDRQPIEQLGMRRRFAKTAEVAGACRQSTAKMVLPNSVD